jgi:hypothetical protein
MTQNQVEFAGPFESYDVVVHGRRVAYLQATMQPGGRVLLELDRRMGVEIEVQQVESIVPFIANCIAVASGYTCHPEPDWGEPKKSHPMPQVRSIGWPDQVAVAD